MKNSQIPLVYKCIFGRVNITSTQVIQTHSKRVDLSVYILVSFYDATLREGTFGVMKIANVLISQYAIWSLNYFLRVLSLPLKSEFLWISNKKCCSPQFNNYHSTIFTKMFAKICQKWFFYKFAEDIDMMYSFINV